MTVDEIEAWIRLVAEWIHERAAELTKLDQAIGDGDHGINLDRGFGAVVASLDAAAEAGTPIGRTAEGTGDAGLLLRHVGRTLVSTVGGASGPLYGSAFLRAAGTVTGRDDVDGPAAVTALATAVDAITGLGKARPGEKTMLDALVPAVDAARATIDGGGTGLDAIRSAADAAEAGAVATIPMLATKGRASYLGERSIGHQDPGATSSALLLRALVDVATR